jgi:uncharacterized protein (DUF58 family)
MQLPEQPDESVAVRRRRIHRRLHLLWLLPVMLLAALSFASNWWAIGIAGALALAFLLCLGIWAASSFDRFDMSVLRQRQTWALRGRGARPRDG